MKILGLDSSAVSASAAVLDDDKYWVNFLSIQSKHNSQTLMPMVQQVLIQTRNKFGRN